MIPRVRIYRENGLQREEFVFWFRDREMQLVLDEYHLQTKETPRHKWRTQHSYNRLQSRYAYMKREDVPLTEDIKQMAYHEFITMITVEE